MELQQINSDLLLAPTPPTSSSDATGVVGMSSSSLMVHHRSSSSSRDGGTTKIINVPPSTAFRRLGTAENVPVVFEKDGDEDSNFSNSSSGSDFSSDGDGDVDCVYQDVELGDGDFMFDAYEDESNLYSDEQYDTDHHPTTLPVDPDGNYYNGSLPVDPDGNYYNGFEIDDDMYGPDSQLPHVDEVKTFLGLQRGRRTTFFTFIDFGRLRLLFQDRHDENNNNNDSGGGDRLGMVPKTPSK